MVGQFSWITGVHTANNIEWLVIDAVLMLRHAAQFLGIYPMGIVESPVVFGCGHNRHIQHRINADTAESSVPGAPATCPSSRVGRSGRAPAWLNYVALVLMPTMLFRHLIDGSLTFTFSVHT